MAGGGSAGEVAPGGAAPGRAAPGGAAPPNWQCYWQQQANRARHYDLLGTCMTMLMLTSNVWRSSKTPSSYATPEARATLRNTQAAFAVAIILHAVVLFAITQRPRQYAVAWQVLTCGRWLSVSGIILASTLLPVFQAGATQSSSGSQCWLLRWTGLLFRTGAMFCFIQFLFYRYMPWPYMAAMASFYVVGSSVINTPPFCQNVISSLGSPQLHADFSTVQSVASLLDYLVGQGQYQQQEQGGSLGAGQLPWQTTADLLGAVCGPQAAQTPALRQACTKALLGQCRATVTTVKFALTYLLLLLMITLERYSKWRFLQQQQQQQQQQQHARGAQTQSPDRASDGAGSSSGSPTGTDGHLSRASQARSSSHQGASAFADPFRSSTAWGFLRIELLKFVVLADVPVLLCWFALSSLLRPLPVEAA